MKDREDHIKHVMGYCQHYNASKMFGFGGQKATGKCDAGIAFKNQFGREPGALNRAPCTRGHEKYDNPAEICPKWIRKTRAQGLASYNEWDKVLQRMRMVNSAIKRWRVRPKPAEDRYETIECPVCKGTLHLSQSSYNGHVHGKCETAGCVSWME